MENKNITAKITATGAASMVPDNAGAVDADIFESGEYVGACTLLPDGEGELSAWGHIDHWADSTLANWLADGLECLDAVSAVVSAVKGATNV